MARRSKSSRARPHWRKPDSRSFAVPTRVEQSQRAVARRCLRSVGTQAQHVRGSATAHVEGTGVARSPPALRAARLRLRAGHAWSPAMNTTISTEDELRSSPLPIGTCSPHVRSGLRPSHPAGDRARRRTRCGAEEPRDLPGFIRDHADASRRYGRLRPGRMPTIPTRRRGGLRRTIPPKIKADADRERGHPPPRRDHDYVVLPHDRRSAPTAPTVNDMHRYLQPGQNLKHFAEGRIAVDDVRPAIAEYRRWRTSEQPLHFSGEPALIAMSRTASRYAASVPPRGRRTRAAAHAIRGASQRPAASTFFAAAPAEGKDSRPQPAHRPTGDGAQTMAAKAEIDPAKCA